MGNLDSARARGEPGFNAVLRRLNVPVSPQRLVFPDREVCLVFGNEITIARLFLNSDAIAELRRAKDTPALFVNWSNVEQAEWATDMAGRLMVSEDRNVAVCVLDTGVTRAHPLLSPVLYSRPTCKPTIRTGHPVTTVGMERRWRVPPRTVI